MLARSKLYSIESKISKALMDNEISHEEKNHRELKESIRMMNSPQNCIHRSDAEKVNLIEEDKEIGFNESIKHNEIINNILKYKYV